MANQRADLGFGDLDDFDPTEFNPPKSKPPKAKPKKEDTAKAAKAAGFKSREVKPEPAETPKPTEPVQRRGRRTGRDAQFNMKTKPETKQAFYDIADANEWGLGETLEKAVELLQKEYGSN